MFAVFERTWWTSKQGALREQAAVVAPGVHQHWPLTEKRHSASLECAQQKSFLLSQTCASLNGQSCHIKILSKSCSLLPAESKPSFHFYRETDAAQEEKKNVTAW